MSILLQDYVICIVNITKKQISSKNYFYTVPKPIIQYKYWKPKINLLEYLT